MELRKDYVLDRWVILSTERSNRPLQFTTQNTKKQGMCFFCPGNEHLTPPEIGRIKIGKSWKMRWFPNKFPAVKPEGNSAIQTHNDFFTFASAYGYHEVITETPFHDKQLWDLSADDLSDLFKVYNHRIQELSGKPNISYVVIFKNHGREAGTSLIHSHTQVAALNFIPKIIKEECGATRNNTCPYCRIIDIEKGSHRKCFENSLFAAFAPYASRFNYEIWIFPKRHIKTLQEFHEEDYKQLGMVLQLVLIKLKQLNTPFNYFLHYSPQNENLHLHLEITPRLSTWAGFEFATETIINSVAPEYAGKFYRGEVSI